MSFIIASLMYTDTVCVVWRSADTSVRSGSRRGTIRRGKSARRARGEGRGARETSSRDPNGLGIVISI